MQIKNIKREKRRRKLRDLDSILDLTYISCMHDHPPSGLWTLCSVSMETTYQWKNRPPLDKRVSGPVPRLIHCLRHSTLITPVTGQGHTFCCAFRRVTLGLLINDQLFNYLSSWQKLWVYCDCISPSLFGQVSRNLGRWVCASTLRVYKVFTETGWGPQLRGDSALGPPV